MIPKRSMLNVFKTKIGEKFGQKIPLNKLHIHEHLRISHEAFNKIITHHFDKNLFTGYEPKYFIKKGFPNHFTFSKRITDNNLHHNITITHAKKIEKLNTIDLPSTNDITIRDPNNKIIPKLDYDRRMHNIDNRLTHLESQLNIEKKRHVNNDDVEKVRDKEETIDRITAKIKSNEMKISKMKKIMETVQIKPTKINISLVDRDQIRDIGFNTALFNRVVYESGLGHKINQIELIKRAVLIKTLDDIKDFHKTGVLKILYQSNNMNNIAYVNKKMLDLKIDESTEKINGKITLDRNKEIFKDNNEKTTIIDEIGQDNYNLCVDNMLRVYREMLLLGEENVEANCDFWIALEHSGKSGSTSTDVLEHTLDGTINGIISYPSEI